MKKFQIGILQKFVLRIFLVSIQKSNEFKKNSYKCTTSNKAAEILRKILKLKHINS